ncbi:MAG TPA: Abi family protein [Trebonia sp.]|nr:Abi family protein [Trebonia sp.]
MHDEVKAYLSYADQVVLLEQRGMDVGDHDDAARVLGRINYYRFSGYWYSFRQRTDEGRGDTFYQGTRLADVVALYEFDARLRTATFSTLAPIELALRALLGHELGRIDPCVHLDPGMLGPAARQGTSYERWRKDYEYELASSREDFVIHHHRKYGGRLPVWAAVELLGWGGLTRLYGFAPRSTQDAIAGMCGLRAPQLSSWLKALNIVRNVCAHHGRLYNRVHTFSPKLPPAVAHPDLHAATTVWTRTFGQLTLIQFLLDRLEVGSMRTLPLVVKTYPAVSMIPLLHLGAETTWQTRSRLWSV